MKPKTSLPLIVGIGHSMVENGIAAAIATALSTSARLGTAIPSANLGRSGGTSRAITINVGAEVATYKPVNGIIPTNTSEVTLTPNFAGPLEASGGAGGETLGYLAGVFGTFKWVPGGPMSFRRAVAGRQVDVPDLVPYVPVLYDRDQLFAFNQGQVKQRYVVEDAVRGFAVLWAGRNDIADPYDPVQLAQTLILRYESIIALTENRQFVVLSELNSTIETPGTRGAEQITIINRLLAERFPLNFVDVTTPFLAADNPVGTLRYDFLHPNAQGRALIAGVVGDAILSRGLLTDVALPAPTTVPAVTPLMVAQRVSVAPFQTVNGDTKLQAGPAQIDTHSGYNQGLSAYIIKEPGIYDVRGFIRLKDGSPAGVSYGVGAGAAFGQSVMWFTTTGLRDSGETSGIRTFARGDQVFAYSYAGQTLDVIEAGLIVRRIG